MALIKDIGPNMGKIEVTLDVTEKSDPREFNKFGKPGRLCNAVGKDASGTIKITLWNEQVDQVNPGDKIMIKNGWASEYQGELQLSTGKYGNLEIVGKGTEPVAQKEATSATKPAAKPAPPRKPAVPEDYEEGGSVSDVEEEDLY